MGTWSWRGQVKAKNGGNEQSSCEGRRAKMEGKKAKNKHDKRMGF